MRDVTGPVGMSALQTGNQVILLDNLLSIPCNSFRNAVLSLRSIGFCLIHHLKNQFWDPFHLLFLYILYVGNQFSIKYDGLPSGLHSVQSLSFNSVIKIGVRQC